MSFFSYRAMDKNGVLIKGSIEKNDAAQVKQYLKALELIEIDVKKMNLLNMNLSDIGLLKYRLCKKDVAYICRQMSHILNSGLSMSTGFDVLTDNSINSGMKKCFAKMKPDIMTGLSIYSCFQKIGVFPAFLINMIRVGEKSDKLNDIMKSMADFYEKDAKISEQMKAAMLYPAFVAATMILVVIASLIYVVPVYSPMFLDAGEVLPLPTRILVTMSNFFITYQTYIAVALLTGMFGVLSFFRTARGVYIKDRIKLIKIFTGKYNIKKLNLYFAMSMSIMLSSNGDIISSLEMAKKVSNNAVFTRQINIIADKICKGSALSGAVCGLNLFDKMLVSMIKLGEETDRLPQALNDCAKYLDEELEISGNRLKELIQPVSTVILGLLLAFIILATMLPSIQVTSFF